MWSTESNIVHVLVKPYSTTSRKQMTTLHTLYYHTSHRGNGQGAFKATVRGTKAMGVKASVMGIKAMARGIRAMAGA